jgi:lysyl-tRNA synthetase class 2
MELANGYQELTDADEQGRRFRQALEVRRQRGAPLPPLDQPLLDALQHGMPRTAGIALGFDRLAMLSLGLKNLDQVVAFPIGRC